MTRYKVLAGRLCIGELVFTKDEIVDGTIIPQSSLSTLINCKHIQVIDEKTIEAKVVVAEKSKSTIAKK